MKLCPVEEQEAVPRRQNWRHRCAGRRIGNERVYRLVLVRREGRNVDKRRHFGIVTRLGDHRSAVGMANENDWFALRSDDMPGRGDVPCKRNGGILDDSDAVAIPLQAAVDALPVRAVYEAAVDENDGRTAFIRE